MAQEDFGGFSFPRDDASSADSTAGTLERTTPYDEFRYPGNFYPQASPERIAMLGTLFGLTPAPVERCRVLELGCGEGGHLVPLAYVLPESRFLGVDLSRASIARADELARRLGTRNVEFRAEDFTQFAADAGSFDYIVAHGVYSWVPAHTQQALLAICGRHLAPNGLAYISYNAYPGCHLRQFARDLALFHTRAIADPAAKVREAHAMLDVMLAAMPKGTLQREVLRNVAKAYRKSDPLTKFELLSEENEPAYFLDFMEQAAGCGLQFVADSDVRFMRTAHLAEDARRWVEAIPDRLLREQYLDFINCRSFRTTLLCRAGQTVNLDVTPERMARLMVVSALKPSKPVGDFTADEPVEFRTAHARAIVCREPMPKAVFLELAAAFPQALRYRELLARVGRRLGRSEPFAAAVEARLISMLVASMVNGVTEFHLYRAPCCATASVRPVASAMARVHAETQGAVASMFLTSFALQDPIARGLLPLLDGTRERRQLQTELEARLPAETREAVTAESIEQALTTLAEAGMLIA